MLLVRILINSKLLVVIFLVNQKLHMVFWLYRGPMPITPVLVKGQLCICICMYVCVCVHTHTHTHITSLFLTILMGGWDNCTFDSTFFIYQILSEYLPTVYQEVCMASTTKNEQKQTWFLNSWGFQLSKSK